jgi:hypothetical protein
MMHTPVILSAALIATFLATSATAGRTISLPFEETFDNGDTWTHDLLWVANGASGTHDSTGGWRGGAAKIFPPTNILGGENGTYAGMGAFGGLDHRRLNVRYLMRIGPTYHTTHQGMPQNKHIIVNKHEGRERGMTMLQEYPDAPYHTFGAFSDNGDITYYATGAQWPNGDDPFKNTDYLDEWFCIEHEWDLDQGIARVYIWTRDGRLDGLYVTAPKVTTSSFSEVQIIGGYFNGYHLSDPNNYIMYDELKIDDGFIGPPDGFLTDSAVSDIPRPTGVTFY